MYQEVLAGSGEAACAVFQPMEEVQLPAVGAHELRRDADPVTASDLGQVPEMGLHGEVAPARGDIVGIGADQLH